MSDLEALTLQKQLRDRISEQYKVKVEQPESEDELDWSEEKLGNNQSTDNPSEVVPEKTLTDGKTNPEYITYLEKQLSSSKNKTSASSTPIMLMTEFRRYNGEENFRDWLVDYVAYCRNRRINPAKTVERYLSGDVKQLYNIIPKDDRSNWGIVYKSLVDWHQPDGQDPKDMRGLYISQNIGESPLVYLGKKMRIAEKNCLPFSSVKSAMIEGWIPEYKTALPNCKTFEELIEELKNRMQFCNQESLMAIDVRGVAHPATKPSNGGDEQQENKPSQYGGKTGRRGPPMCYRCNKVGHISRNCRSTANQNTPNGGNGNQRKAQVCFTCNQEGHFSRDCTNEEAKQERAAFLAAKEEVYKAFPNFRPKSTQK